jgi:hypothetical protein
LWSAACKHIQEAKVIVFVGYRFPPSDAEAREKLLKALTANVADHVELHIVLGPDRRIPDVVRLQQLLRYSMASAGRKGQRVWPEGWALGEGTRLVDQRKDFWLTTHALYAEDFFTVWDRDVLWPPRMVEQIREDKIAAIESLPPD